MQLSNDIIVAELSRTVERMQSFIKEQQFELAQVKKELKQLKSDHTELKHQLESTNSELEWIDKRSFVSILVELGLMDRARAQSSRDSADNMRYLSRLMRDWHIFRIHEGTNEPSPTKHVWKLSNKKFLFHKARAVDQFRRFTTMRNAFDRTDQD